MVSLVPKSYLVIRIVTFINSISWQYMKDGRLEWPVNIDLRSSVDLDLDFGDLWRNSGQ